MIRVSGRPSSLSFHRGFTKFIKMATGRTARTGETCPESGVWQVQGTPSTTAPIAKGNRMPPYDGRAVTWVLIRLA